MTRITHAATALAATAALAATTTLLSVQSADAEGLGGANGVRYVRSTVTIPASMGEPTEAHGAATCPKGWRSVGGGQTIRGGEGRGIAAGMKFHNRQWYAQAWQVDSPATSLTTYAVCLGRTGSARRTRPSTSCRRGRCRWTSQALAPVVMWSAADRGTSVSLRTA